MSSPLFESLVTLKLFLSQSSKEEFQKTLPLFSLTELADCFTLLKIPSLDAQEKLEALLQFIDSPKTLEMIGKNLSSSSFVNFLEFLNQDPHRAQNRLNFILIGLPPSVFSQALHHLQDKHLATLKQEGILEPLHYHLMQFVHEGESLKEKTEKNLAQLQQEISLIQVEELTESTFDTLLRQIDHLRNELSNYLKRASAALALVWHTDRLDLIEKLSSIHETIHYQLTHFIGHPSIDQLSATGLYAILDQSLSNIYDSSLKDDDAAMEGMTRLSIWQLKDYWEMGLLPLIQNPTQLDLNSEKYNEKERWDYQQHLMALVQQQLERLKIEKVKDLKKLHLFSKALLKAYIDRNQHLLMNEPMNLSH